MNYEEAYEEQEAMAEKIREENENYLQLFYEELQEKGISTKTANKHTRNIDFYLNQFLLHYEPMSMEDGCFQVDSFLGDFFIRKCMWSTPSAIKQYTTSLKKFYKCMLEHGHVEKDSYNSLCEEIKESLPEWMDLCEQYNSPDEENPFGFFGLLD